MHKHSGNVVICNICQIEMCFNCAVAIVETDEWVHKTCKRQAERELKAAVNN